jgi:hypothetical protein
VKPALQVQAASAEPEIGELELVGHVTQVAADVAAVVSEYVPAEQSLHKSLPVDVLYLPATQAVHTPPFGPVKPRLQVQAVTTTLVVGELELTGHVVHKTLPVVSL